VAAATLKSSIRYVGIDSTLGARSFQAASRPTGLFFSIRMGRISRIALGRFDLGGRLAARLERPNRAAMLRAARPDSPASSWPGRWPPPKTSGATTAEPDMTDGCIRFGLQRKPDRIRGSVDIRIMRSDWWD